MAEFKLELLSDGTDFSIRPIALHRHRMRGECSTPASLLPLHESAKRMLGDRPTAGAELREELDKRGAGPIDPPIPAIGNNRSLYEPRGASGVPSISI